MNKTKLAQPVDVIPEGWYKAGSHPQHYQMIIDTVVKHGGKASAHIKFIGQTAEGFGTLMQTFKADLYRGQRVRMTAWMKTEKAASAQLWMRLDGDEQKTLGFDNMDNRAVTGTTGWKKYEITLDVPDNTINIAFGALVGGKGQSWTDDFEFEVVGQDVPTTNILIPEDYPEQPLNLDFES